MKKVLTKKKAYEIIEAEYGKTGYKSEPNQVDSMIGPLCMYAPWELGKDWNKYWRTINTENHVSVTKGLETEEYTAEDWDIIASLTRLILLHHFIEDTYK